MCVRVDMGCHEEPILYISVMKLFDHISLIKEPSRIRKEALEKISKYTAELRKKYNVKIFLK